nr:pentatricopeptide repeat-containing protein At4g38150-like [Ipomoea batatas]
MVEKRGMKPNAATLVRSFEGLVEVGMEEEGRELVEMVKKKGVVPEEGKLFYGELKKKTTCSLDDCHEGIPLWMEGLVRLDVAAIYGELKEKTTCFLDDCHKGISLWMEGLVGLDVAAIYGELNDKTACSLDDCHKGIALWMEGQKINKFNLVMMNIVMKKLICKVRSHEDGDFDLERSPQDEADFVDVECRNAENNDEEIRRARVEGKFELEVDTLYDDGKQFKKAMINYAVYSKKNIYFVRNELKRVSLTCDQPCPFQAHG